MKKPITCEICGDFQFCCNDGKAVHDELLQVARNLREFLENNFSDDELKTMPEYLHVEKTLKKASNNDR